MIALELKEIAEIVGGTLYDVDNPAVRITGSVEFDSRKISAGGLFLCLPGGSVDGHDFAEKAIENGAAAVIAARRVGVPAIVVEPKGPVEGDGANADIYANDADGSAAAVVRALSDLARYVTEELTKTNGLTIIGLTGSAGKTSTKDLLAAILREEGDTVAPPGSFNNEIGHPYTALRCTENTDYLVAELSARGIGHIKHLTDIATPRIGVVLNVGTAHLGEFGSRENIAKAKGELVEGLPAAEDGGIAVLNADDVFVASMSTRTNAKVVTFSSANPPAVGADYFATDISLDKVARPSFTLHAPNAKPVAVSLQVFGVHQVSNALAAAAAAIEAGVAAESAAKALQGHQNSSAHRMDVRTRTDGVTIINDSYNANPDSMHAAIAALGYTASGRPGVRSIAVLGEMAELGDIALEAHLKVGSELAKYDINTLIVVGDSDNCQAMATAAQNEGINVRTSQDIDGAVACITDILDTSPDGVEHWSERELKDVVLVKASNTQRLWRVCDRLLSGEQRD